jgi:hypothetical protein
VKDVPQGLVTFIGISELLGGLGLVLPQLSGILPWLTPLAALGLALIMLLAMGFHARRREPQAIAINLVLRQERPIRCSTSGAALIFESGAFRRYREANSARQVGRPGGRRALQPR